MSSTPAKSRRYPVPKLAVLATCLLSLALPSQAAAAGHVYWTNPGADFSGTTIGRANLDGSDPNQGFVTGATGPTGIAVDAEHIYWSNITLGTIGRANLDGSNPDQSFITGASGPLGLAVDAGHIYWANNGSMGSDSRIGRANLDGSGADQSFITGASGPGGVAVNAEHIYWSNINDSTIGRANLDGSGANQSLVSAGIGPGFMAVDANHVYWANFVSNTIARANLDGSAPDPNFVSGLTVPMGIAVDANHIYWGSLGGTAIGRVNLDGSSLDHSFISAAGSLGVAVDMQPEFSVSPASHDFGSRAVGSGDSPAQTFTVTNPGNAPLAVSGVSLQGSGASQFRVVGDDCASAPVAAGTSCAVRVSFSPSSAGPAAATLSFAHNGSGSPSTVSLSGTSTSAGPAIVDFTISAKRSRQTINKLKFKFRLSEPATVKLVVQRKYGRKQGRHCVPTTRKNRGRKRCAIYRRAGSKEKRVQAGSQTLTFDASKLGPGAYRATLTAEAANGISDPARLIFFRAW